MHSENEFLSQYSQNDYERPSLTADIVAFMIRSEKSDNYKRNSETKLSILLINRGEHPFKNHWALPGGFLQPSETIEECALREITEEANVTPVSLMPVGVFSEPGRDPRDGSFLTPSLPLSVRNPSNRSEETTLPTRSGSTCGLNSEKTVMISSFFAMTKSS